MKKLTSWFSRNRQIIGRVLIVLTILAVLFICNHPAWLIKIFGTHFDDYDYKK